MEEWPPRNYDPHAPVSLTFGPKTLAKQLELAQKVLAHPSSSSTPIPSITVAFYNKLLAYTSPESAVVSMSLPVNYHQVVHTVQM